MKVPPKKQKKTTSDKLGTWLSLYPITSAPFYSIEYLDFVFSEFQGTIQLRLLWLANKYIF
jgi:hypothetical protein